MNGPSTVRRRNPPFCRQAGDVLGCGHRVHDKMSAGSERGGRSGGACRARLHDRQPKDCAAGEVEPIGRRGNPADPPTRKAVITLRGRAATDHVDAARETKALAMIREWKIVGGLSVNKASDSAGRPKRPKKPGIAERCLPGSGPLCQLMPCIIGGAAISPSSSEDRLRQSPTQSAAIWPRCPAGASTARRVSSRGGSAWVKT